MFTVVVEEMFEGYKVILVYNVISVIYILSLNQFSL